MTWMLLEQQARKTEAAMFSTPRDPARSKHHILLRAALAGLFALLGFVLLGWRLWHLQVAQHGNLALRAERNRMTVVPLPPQRGLIFDRNGQVLAHNVRDYVLEIIPAQVQELPRVLAELGHIVPLSDYQLRRFHAARQQSNRHQRVLLRNRISEEQAAVFASQAFRFPGVYLNARWLREYPQGALAAHVLGYVGRISEADLKQLEDEDLLGAYRGTVNIGKKGVEKTWESLLHGSTGWERLEVTAGGKPVRTLARQEPQPGADLILSLDAGLQRVSEAQFEGKRGALVALDPRNGEVLAMVSAPAFDPNLFIDGIDVESWNQLNTSLDYPLINRPLYSTYPIGSTYKPFVALAALELGRRSATERINDIGYFDLGGQRFRNARGAVFGPTDMHRAIAVSSDTYFYSLGLDIGITALHDFSKPFGFGQLTGIDLDGERAGILPSPDWKRKAYRNPEQQHWYAGETVSVAVGQGYNAFTMLQLAQATAILANQGVAYRPHLLRAIRRVDSGQEENWYADGEEQAQTMQMVNPPVRTIALKPENLQVIREAMVAVTRQGTAQQAFKGAAYLTAGKTGTAQVYSLRGAKYDAQAIDERLRDHALFMAYAPANDPQIALALIVENVGWGATAAAPVARAVLDYWLDPSREQKSSEKQKPPASLATAVP